MSLMYLRAVAERCHAASFGERTVKIAVSIDGIAIKGGQVESEGGGYREITILTSWPVIAEMGSSPLRAAVDQVCAALDRGEG